MFEKEINIPNNQLYILVHNVYNGKEIKKWYTLVNKCVPYGNAGYNQLFSNESIKTY